MLEQVALIYDAASEPLCLVFRNHHETKVYW